MEGELADILDEEEAIELRECFLPQPADMEEAGLDNEIAGGPEAMFEEGGHSEIDKGTVAEVEAGFEHIAEAIGLVANFEVGGGGATGASSSSGAPPAPEEEGPTMAEQQPWERLSEVSAQGYVYDGGRSVMRIQRGKPANSVTVNCYIHSQCKMLLTMRRCPDDMMLKRWFCSVPPPAPGASPEASRALGRKHMDDGLRQWGGRKK